MINTERGLIKLLAKLGIQSAKDYLVVVSILRMQETTVWLGIDDK